MTSVAPTERASVPASIAVLTAAGAPPTVAVASPGAGAASTLGGASTTTATVSLLLSSMLLTALTVALPALTAVTMPDWLTVATAALLLDQATVSEAPPVTCTVTVRTVDDPDASRRSVSAICTDKTPTAAPQAASSATIASGNERT